MRTTEECIVLIVQGAEELYGTASVIADDSKMGCVIMGILSFILGICTTLILHKIFHGKNDDIEEIGSKYSVLEENDEF